MATYVYTATYETIYTSIPLTAGPARGTGGTPTVWDWPTAPADGRWQPTASSVNQSTDNGNPSTGVSSTLVSTGDAILSGHGVPPAALGRDGEFWLDVDSNTLWGPRLAGRWPSSGTVLGSSTSGYLPSSGGTLTGDLTLTGAHLLLNNTPADPTTSSAGIYALKLGSSFGGGENTFDSTSRLQLESYQRAQQTNGSGSYASYGEVLRIYSRRWDSKQMIAWYGPTAYNGNGDPATADTAWFWMGAHYEANDHASVHGHWSIEVPDTSNNLQTRFEFRIWDPTTGVFGMDRTIAKFNAADVVVAQDNGALYMAAVAGTTKNVYFTNDTTVVSGGTATGKRWGVQADGTAEGGSNVGTDFRLNRYNDAGVFLDSPLFVKRSTGVVGIGNITNPAARMDVTEAGSRHTIEAIQTTSSTITFAAYSGILGAVANRYVDFRVTGDSSGRFVIFGDGKHEWGDGGAGGRDTNLYRDAVNSLKTDDALTVALAFKHLGATLGFYGATAATKPTVAGSRGGNAALASLITALATLGLVTDSTTA